jgi:hypothetical protein
VAAHFTQADLEGYLDEALAPDEMAELEEQLRHDPDLVKQLAAINSRRDAGVHTLGEIWRRHRISCPNREDLGSYLLGILEPDYGAFVKFHIETVRCRLCTANLIDMRLQQEETAPTAATRRHRFFQSSAGYLRKKN